MSTFILEKKMLFFASFLVLLIDAKGYPYPQSPKNPNGPVVGKNPNYDFFIPERSPYTYQLLEPQLGYQPQQPQLGYQPQPQQHQPQHQPGYQQINPQQAYPG